MEALGHPVDYASDGLQARALCTHNRYEAIILDVGLPGASGLDVCRWLRTEARLATPVIMLTARDLETDVLAGFEAGADDYLKKPFSLKELAARLAALLRRGGVAGAERAVADLRLDVATHTVHRAGVRRPVTPSGLRLLDLLMRSSPAVVTRDQMIELLWGDAPPSSDAALRAHVHLLRQAVDAPGLPRLLHTVHGVGYRLAEEPDAA
ncbi:MAG: response regulator transcription factor [Proteobacteria bacterium]|nr:response regulator transcription factor [Pseudomonadota bacterium]